ncbi:MAG: pyrimidine dimer DNA glycosylase/endonuclease V [Solibacillus sp.]
MRLWHTDIIPTLPKSQLLAQWRELNSIFAKEDKHILINYIYDYPREDLLLYTNIVLAEMRKRGIQIRTIDKMARYFEHVAEPLHYTPFARHHDAEYLEICYFNLKEKYLRGQKDYREEQFLLLQKLYDAKKD